MTATAIDLFAGCGGFSVGVIAAGFKVVAGIDHYPRCIWTYDHNHEEYGSRAIRMDLKKAHGSEILSQAGVESVDLVCGGPPCQSFSIRGKREGLKDVRGTLVFDFARLVDEIKPRAFIFENVANLASKAMKPVLDSLLEKFKDSGYKCSHKILLAADFGIAQNRRRLFIVGSRDTPPLALPEPTHSEKPEAKKFRHLPVTAVLDDIPDVETPGAEKFANHEPTRHTEEMLAAFRVLAPGARDPKSHHDRLHPERPGFTLRAGVGNFTPLRPIHHQYDRVLSVRESARLQSFPDTFVWPPNVPRLQQYRQVGNAVPPLLAAAVAGYVGEQLGLSLKPVEVKFPGVDKWTRWGRTARPHQMRLIAGA